MDTSAVVVGKLRLISRELSYASREAETLKLYSADLYNNAIAMHLRACHRAIKVGREGGLEAGLRGILRATEAGLESIREKEKNLQKDYDLIFSQYLRIRDTAVSTLALIEFAVKEESDLTNPT